ncbi:cytochrome P450 4V2-like [Lineus longissimus]|uniref:cytochrome P450 4V2-like n=1 Tax=Lineus longissimus TaxID=88925 RepID=UPI002B4F0F49
MAIFLAVVLALLLVFITTYLYNFRKLKKAIDQFGGPPALPIIGNAHMFEPKGSDFYAQLMQFIEENKESGIFRIWLGPVPVLVVTNPEIVEIILSSSKHLDKSYVYKFLHPWLATGLLTSTGDKWRMRRKLLTPTFHFKILDDFMTVFNEQTDIFTNILREKISNDKAFDIFPYITHCALDIICETAMGKKIYAQNDCDSEYVRALFKLSTQIQRRQKSPWLWADWAYFMTSDGKDQKSCLKTLHDFTDSVIKERRKALNESLGDTDITGTEPAEWDKDRLGLGKKKLAFLDMLLYASADGKRLTDEDIREEVDTFMFEGHDTTAAAISWAVYSIGRYQDIQKKIHEEMDEIFGDSDRPITHDDLRSMKYLERVLKESLRLFPSVPIFGRVLSEDTKIGGVIVPKGAQAVIVPPGVHRNEKYYPDPEVFDPDRFLPEKCAGRHPYAYVPFSAGPRNCIGQKFAQMEEKIFVASLMRNFYVESIHELEDMLPCGELVLRPERGVWVKLTPRANNIEQ